MFGIKDNQINMNFKNLLVCFFTFMIIPIIAESSIKINNEGKNYKDNLNDNEILYSNSVKNNKQMIENNFGRGLYSKSKTEIIDISHEKNLINLGDRDNDLLFVSTLGKKKIF